MLGFRPVGSAAVASLPVTTPIFARTQIPQYLVDESRQWLQQQRLYTTPSAAMIGLAPQLPSQQFYPLPDLNDWWQQTKQMALVSATQPQQPAQRLFQQDPGDWRQQTISRTATIPRPKQGFVPSQQFYALPDLNDWWYARVWYAPQYIPTPPPTRQASQQFYALPDLTDWWQQLRLQPIPAQYVPTPPPLRPPPQRYYSLPDFSDWWQQVKIWPVPSQYLPTPPPLRPPSQQFYPLPDLNDWWQQLRLQPSRSLFLVFQEGTSGVYGPVTGSGQAGMGRVSNDIEGYVVWIGVDALPDLTQPPAGFSKILPFSIPQAPPVSGTQRLYILVKKQDTFGLMSQNSLYSVLTVDSSGNTHFPDIAAPQSLALFERDHGKIKVLATYPGFGSDLYPATDWKIWIKTTLPDPAVDSPVAVVSISGKTLGFVSGANAPGIYYVMVGLYRSGDQALSPTIYTTIKVHAGPDEVVAVPSGFDVEP